MSSSQYVPSMTPQGDAGTSWLAAWNQQDQQRIPAGRRTFWQLWFGFLFSGQGKQEFSSGWSSRKNWSVAPNQSKHVHYLILSLGLLSRQEKPVVEKHPSYCMGELSKPSVMSYLTVLEAAGAPPNTINLNLRPTWPLIRADLSSWAVLTQMHINLYSTASRGAFICNHLGKLPPLSFVIPLTCRLCHMQMQLFKMDID